MKFSIVIPLYNKEKEIYKTIESALNQKHFEFEVLIVNDGSTDNSLSVVQSVNDPRVRLINKENGGVSSARNKGILEAKNEWIVFLDGDDILYNNALEEYQILHEKYNDAKFLCASYDMTVKKYPSERKYYMIDNYRKATIYSLMRTGFGILCTDCVCIHKSCFVGNNLFREDITHGEDLEMWRRLSSEFGLAKSEVAVAYYNTEAENRSDKVDKKERKQWIDEESFLSTKMSLYNLLFKGCEHYHILLTINNNIQKMWYIIKHSLTVSLFIIISMLFRLRIFTSRGEK